MEKQEKSRSANRSRAIGMSDKCDGRLPGPNGVPHGVLVHTTPPPAEETALSGTGPAAGPAESAPADDEVQSPQAIVDSIGAEAIAAEEAANAASNRSWIAGVVIGVVVLVGAAAGVCVIARRRRRAATRFHVRPQTMAAYTLLTTTC